MPWTREECYHAIGGGDDAAVSRAFAFAPWVDMIWLKTKIPDLK